MTETVWTDERVPAEVRTLLVSWSVSKGRETYGYNICRLDDTTTRKRYRCMGGGYDMLGTSFGEWLEDVAQDRLRAIGARAYQIYYGTTPGRVGQSDYNRESGLYGMTRYDFPHDKSSNGRIRLDGGCGLESMRRIAEAVGITTRAILNRRGHTVGFTVTINDLFDNGGPVALNA